MLLIRKAKLTYTNGRIEYIETDKADKDLLYQCTYENFDDSFGDYLRGGENQNQIKVVEVDNYIYIFKYNKQQGFYMYI